MNNTIQWRRRLTLALLGGAILLALFFGFRPQPVEVDVATASVAPLQVTIEQEGRTRVVDRYVVTAPVNGYARRVKLEVGSSVERGEAVVELEPLRADALDPRRHDEAQARIAAAGSAASAAEQRADAAASNAQLAQTELKRIRMLRQAGHVALAAEDRASSDAERSAAELRSAQFAVATARHELDAARSMLRHGASGGASALVTVRSPVAGQVLQIPHKNEGAVAAGQPLVEIGDPRALEVQVDLLSADAVRIGPGTLVMFQRWGGEGKLEGVVRVVEPTGFTKVSALGVEEQRVWVIIAFSSPAAAWQRLGDGYRVEASFILWDEPKVLQIPASALFRDGAHWAVFKLEGKHAVKQRVEIGQRTGLRAQITAGINEGERVIAHPDDSVHEGVRVTAR